MLSKARIKLIQSLNLKKHRSELKLFVVEGKKQVTELLTSNYQINCIVATPNWANAFAQDIKNNTELIIVKAEELKKASLLQTPQEVMAVVEIHEHAFTPQILNEQFTIVLDGIQDPGNMGTIVRIADWYRIKNIVCSNDCVDILNPKTIQATMGSFTRVNVFYTALDELFKNNALPVFGALMDGESLYQTPISEQGILLIGNEGKGISNELQPYITNPITIPRVGGADSLNAGIATAIICDARARLLATGN
jgi:TrmH family RNA methyltransferase